MRDHNPVILDEFNGLWARGDAEPCPVDCSTDFINLKFIESGFVTRDGLDIVLATATSVLRIYNYPDAPLDGFLELRSDNKIYHHTGAIGSFNTFLVLGPITGMTDFAFVSINGRAYLSPTVNDNLGGLPGEFVYVYDGGQVNAARKAAGTAPTNAEGAMTAANSATAGNVEAGIHVFGVVYETNSGFLTQIGPDTLPVVTADGTHKVDLAAIPIFGGGGGTLITKRHIVASKLIAPADYTGDTRSYQLFFVSGGTINDNTTTTLTVNFYDSELIEDASHLLDLRSTIPAVGGLGTYHNRMLAWDFDGGINICLVSAPGEPEAFDTVSGFIEIPREGTGISHCQEYRDILYVNRFDRTIAFNDNGDIPTSWPSATIDQGLGCGKHGLSTVSISAGGVNIESVIMVNDQGIHLFSGTFATPELSYKIKDYWLALPRSDIRTGKVSAFTNPVDQLIYVNIPSLNTVLIGDFANGMSANKIRWSKWVFGAIPNTMLLFDKDNKLFIGMPTGIHYINVGKTNDTISPSTAVAIPNPTMITALIGDETNQDDENIYHFGGVRVRVTGSGLLRATYIGLDGILTNVLAPITMGTTPGQMPFALANLMNERARLQLQTTAINETLKVNKIICFTKPIYSSYPM